MIGSSAARVAWPQRPRQAVRASYARARKDQMPHEHAHTAPTATAGATAGPMLIEVTRGDMVESRHRADVAIVDADGKVVHAWGDIEPPVYGRSAIKPLQALPLIESGAADRFGVSVAEVAL